MRKLTLILCSTLIATVSVVIFIHFSNDHIECETVLNNFKNADGKIVKIESHVCNEKYSF